MSLPAGCAMVPASRSPTANSLYCAASSQAEIDQRSREARLRLEQMEALLVPGIRRTRGWISLPLQRLTVRIRPRPNGNGDENRTETRPTRRKLEEAMRNPGSTGLQAVATSTASGGMSRRRALWMIAFAGVMALSGGAMPKPGFAAHAVQSVDARVIAGQYTGRLGYRAGRGISQ